VRAQEIAGPGAVASSKALENPHSQQYASLNSLPKDHLAFTQHPVASLRPNEVEKAKQIIGDLPA